ncbi:hypothetical protein J1605_003261 [Eschrichtius robustus]|uniref:Transmembrane protein n=1 Tax=Eschrichtius robustus TaxID=9764 RepID=A0AB34HS90_ESCRO|nr:hypothetical protein J1605_003261 [Eschrichtius robustus]
MPRSSRNPGDSCDPPENVVHVPREVRPRSPVVVSKLFCNSVSPSGKWGHHASRDAFLLPIHIIASGLTQGMLGCMSWITCLACFLRTQAHQVLFNTCRILGVFYALAVQSGNLAGPHLEWDGEAGEHISLSTQGSLFFCLIEMRPFALWFLEKKEEEIKGQSSLSKDSKEP